MGGLLIQVGLCKLYFTVPEHAKFKTYAAFGDRREGVVSSRTYFYEGEEQCDKNMQIFLEAIDGVSGRCGITTNEPRHGKTNKMSV